MAVCHSLLKEVAGGSKGAGSSSGSKGLVDTFNEFMNETRAIVMIEILSPIFTGWVCSRINVLNHLPKHPFKLMAAQFLDQGLLVYFIICF